MMRVISFILSILVISLSAARLPAQDNISIPNEPASNESGYLVGPGDVLDISVWKNPDLSKIVTVLPDGKIAFPLVGEITASGKTVLQITAEMKAQLESYVPDVDLIVIVAQVNSMIIYVIGRVNNPGRFLLNTYIDVLQALSMAGGLNPFAKRDKIKIFRKVQGELKTFPFEYNEVANAGNLSQNILLQRGDVIIVP